MKTVQQEYLNYFNTEFNFTEIEFEYSVYKRNIPMNVTIVSTVQEINSGLSVYLARRSLMLIVTVPYRGPLIKCACQLKETDRCTLINKKKNLNHNKQKK